MEALGEEVVVLEVAEHPEVQRHAQRDEHLPLARVLDPVDGEPAEVVHHRRDDQEREEPGVPAGVEVIARGQQQQVLPAVMVRRSQ